MSDYFGVVVVNIMEGDSYPSLPMFDPCPSLLPLSPKYSTSSHPSPLTMLDLHPPFIPAGAGGQKDALSLSAGMPASAELTLHQCSPRIRLGH